MNEYMRVFYLLPYYYFDLIEKKGFTAYVCSINSIGRTASTGRGKIARP